MRIGTIAILLLTTAACSKGGNLVLEPGGRNRNPQKGSPFVQVNQGGKALLVTNGQSETTAVHALNVTVQPVSAKNLNAVGGSGHSAIINKVTK